MLAIKLTYPMFPKNISILKQYCVKLGKKWVKLNKTEYNILGIVVFEEEKIIMAGFCFVNSVLSEFHSFFTYKYVVRDPTYCAFCFAI